ncbi:YbhB/YbcL family Raf kinase inhibitor-like protein [Nautilia lithotrophica]
MKKLILILANILFAFEIFSPAFKNNAFIPKKYTCDGLNISIPLIIKNIPKNTKSLAVIMQDPDAPFGVFTHWILYNIPLKISKIPENLPKTEITNFGLQGINDFNKIGYGGPCPPPGKPHHYIITAIALNKNIDLKPGLTIKEFLDKIKTNIISYTQYIGLYKRSIK